jgi:hypothetical protein
MKTAADWLKDPEIYTTSLMLLLTDAFGTEFIEWDPTTVSLEVKDAFGFEPKSSLMDRIQAGSSLFTSNLFQVSLETFNAVCNAMNFGVVASETFLPADLDDVLWAVTEARLLMGPDFDDDFSSNIQNYVGVLLAQDGIYKAPSVLSWANIQDVESKVPDTLDDVEMERAFWEEQNRDKENLEAENVYKMKQLLAQIRILPLKTGSAEFVDQILKNMDSE